MLKNGAKSEPIMDLETRQLERMCLVQPQNSAAWDRFFLQLRRNNSIPEIIPVSWRLPLQVWLADRSMFQIIVIQGFIWPGEEPCRDGPVYRAARFARDRIYFAIEINFQTRETEQVPIYGPTQYPTTQQLYRQEFHRHEDDDLDYDEEPDLEEPHREIVGYETHPKRESITKRAQSYSQLLGQLLLEAPQESLETFTTYQLAYGTELVTVANSLYGLTALRNYSDLLGFDARVMSTANE